MEQSEFEDRAARLNRRQFPRILLGTDVEIGRGDRLVRAEVHDLSQGGMQILCDQETALELAFSSPTNESPTGSQTDERLTVYFHERPLDIAARCRCCYAKETEDGRIAIGLEFLELGEESILSLSALFEEAAGIKDKRRYPRIEVNAPIEITRNNTPPISSTVHDISPDGMQLRCDAKTGSKLGLLRLEKEGSNGTEIEAALRIQLAEGPLQLNTRNRCCYVREVLNDYFAIGIEFVHMYDESRDHLMRFVERAIEPA